MPAFGIEKITLPLDSPLLHILLAQRLGEFSLIPGIYSDTINLSSSQRREGKFGVRLKILNEYLFFWYEDKEAIKEAQTKGDILKIGREGMKRWKLKETIRHNNK